MTNPRSTESFGPHIELEPEAELELTLAKENWASVHPIDPGTRHIVMDAFKVLIDKDSTLERLREHLTVS